MKYVIEQVGSRGPKNPEIARFLAEFESRRDAEKGMSFSFEGDPDPTAEIRGTGIAIGGHQVNLMRLDDRYMAEYSVFGAASLQKQVFALVDEAFVDELFDEAEGTNYGDAARTNAWLNVFKRHGIR